MPGSGCEAAATGDLAASLGDRNYDASFVSARAVFTIDDNPKRVQAVCHH
jgi:hypothetical protein